MRYDLSNPFQAKQACKRLESLIAKGVSIDLTEKKKRTYSQNDYLHLCLRWFALTEGYTVAYVKEQYYKLLCSPDIFIEDCYDRHLHRGVRHIKSSADITKEQMSISISRFVDWAVSEAEVPMPDPNDYATLKYIEDEIERNKRDLIGNETY